MRRFVRADNAAFERHAPAAFNKCRAAVTRTASGKRKIFRRKRAASLHREDTMRRFAADRFVCIEDGRVLCADGQRFVDNDVAEVVFSNAGNGRRIRSRLDRAADGDARMRRRILDRLLQTRPCVRLGAVNFNRRRKAMRHLIIEDFCCGVFIAVSARKRFYPVELFFLAFCKAKGEFGRIARCLRLNAACAVGYFDMNRCARRCA